MRKFILFIISLSLSFTVVSQSKYSVFRNALLNNGFSICEDLYTQISQGQVCIKNRSFASDFTYRIYVFTEDSDVKDIDLYLLRGDGTEYMKDTDRENWCVLTFKLYYGRYMDIKVVNYSSYTPSFKSKIYILVGYKY